MLSCVVFHRIGTSAVTEVLDVFVGETIYNAYVKRRSNFPC